MKNGMKIRNIALNIETCAQPDALKHLPPPKVAYGPLKDPVKRREKDIEAAEAQRTKIALDPWYGQVLCVTLAVEKPDNDGNNTLTPTTLWADQHGEARLLQWLWRQLEPKRNEESNSPEQVTRLITFNGASFDLPFLMTRSLVHRVPVSVVFATDRYQVTNPYGFHFDVYQYFDKLLPDNPLRLGRRLRDYARAILGETFPYEEVDQSALDSLSKSSEGRQTIKGLCEWNTRMAFHLAKLIQTINGDR